jgi:hypothetical protein
MSYKTSLLACLQIITKFGGGGDDSILWLSFAQQKPASWSEDIQVEFKRQFF